MTSWTQQVDSCQISENQSFVNSFTSNCADILKKYSAYNFLFILLGTIELLASLIFFNTLSKSIVLASSLALILMTLFCYFVLRAYFQSKKPQHLLSICERTKKELKHSISSQSDSIDAKLSLASLLCRLANNLKDLEYDIYKAPKGLQTLSFSFEKLGAWLHWQDIHAIKEWLFFESIDLYIDLIKEQPMQMQFHVALANTYVMLSKIYATEEQNEEERWLPTEKINSNLDHKFTLCAQKAIEEFKILNDNHPNDPWIHTQLAYSYHDLKMPQKEIEAYEKILELNQQVDDDILHKLGTLYFLQGSNSKGLKLYEQLKNLGSHKAETLIKHYGTYDEALSLEN